jgi:uncharacterized protein YkwD
MRKLFLAASLLVSSLAFGQDYGDSLVKKDFVSAETIEYWMVRYINVERTKLGLDTLIVDSDPDNIAKSHSAWMLETGKYEHSKLNIYEIIMKGGKGSDRYSHKFFAQAVVNGWMDSPAHHAIIINPSNKFVGAGFAYSVRQSDGFISYYHTVTFK